MCSISVHYFSKLYFLHTQMSSQAATYKIVETIENGARNIAAVPAGWENGGKLMWPPNNVLDKVVKKASVPPGNTHDGWKEFDCIVKRQDIISYIEARKQLKAMSDESDTSTSDLPLMAAQTVRSAAARKFVANADSSRLDYNEMVNFNRIDGINMRMFNKLLIVLD